MLRLTVFEIFAVKIWDFGALGIPSTGEDESGSHIHHHAEFVADWLHLHQDIRPRTEEMQKITAIIISDKTLH